MNLILTEEEQQLILNQRAKKEADKPKKSAQLKHDLYYVDSCDIGSFEHMYSRFVTEEEINSLIQGIKESFALIIPKGTEFICFIEYNNESWYDDDGYGIEAQSKYWANDHLENLKLL